MSGAFQPVFGAVPGGGSAISNSGVAYIRSDGNNATAEIGNPAKPYHMTGGAQAAYNAGARVFDIGVGNAGTLTINQDLGPHRLFFRGRGVDNSEIFIQNFGTNGVGSGPGGGEGEQGGTGNPGEAAVSMTYESDGTIYITVDIKGGDGADGGPGGPGSAGESTEEPDMPGGQGGTGGEGGVGGEGAGVNPQIFIHCVGSIANIRSGDPGSGGIGGTGGPAGTGPGGDGPPGDPGATGPDGSSVDTYSWGHDKVVYRRCEMESGPTFQCKAYGTSNIGDDLFYLADNIN